MSTVTESLQVTSPTFSGHETFTLRYGWLKKAMDAVSEDPNVFSRDDALVRLGVGKNMVRSIRHWGLATGLIEEDCNFVNNRGRHLRPSELGAYVFADNGYDPYLEDVGTLWLLHYLLASNPSGPTTWYWVFNHFPESLFTVDRLVDSLANLATREEWNRVAEGTLRRDVNCFVRTYVPSRTSKAAAEDVLDCPLAELDLLYEVEDGQHFSFRRGTQSTLPPHIFVYALLNFWNDFAPSRNALLFDEIAYYPRSPGRIFKLSESAVTDLLDSLSVVTSGQMSFDITAGLMQVYRRKGVDSDAILRSYYTTNRRRRR